MKCRLLIGVLIAVSSVFGQAQTQVFVAGNASGYFGNPLSGQMPLVSAIAVKSATTITVTYISGTVTDINGVDTGPEGVPCDYCAQLPLEEAGGFVQQGTAQHLDALIGVFVPATTVSRPGFSPIDGTKGVAQVGILPNGLFLIGTSKTFSVKSAGTLYLGVNDNFVSDNGGGFTVSVSAE
jgi:hypothetical protein